MKNTNARDEPQKSALASVKLLKDLTAALSTTLAAMDFARLHDIRLGINFYDEVQRFEIDLIRQALKVTQGNQTRAAKLLALNIKTLNHKIKTYHIEWQKSGQAVSGGTTDGKMTEDAKQYSNN